MYSSDLKLRESYSKTYALMFAHSASLPFYLELVWNEIWRCKYQEYVLHEILGSLEVFQGFPNMISMIKFAKRP